MVCTGWLYVPTYYTYYGGHRKLCSGIGSFRKRSTDGWQLYHYSPYVPSWPGKGHLLQSAVLYSSKVMIKRISYSVLQDVHFIVSWSRHIYRVGSRYAQSTWSRHIYCVASRYAQRTCRTLFSISCATSVLCLVNSAASHAVSVMLPCRCSSPSRWPQLQRLL
jgi:hypothetical protein